MSSHIKLSPTQPADHDAIERLLDQAFGTQRRTKSSYRLREGSTAVPGLSFVVRDEALGLVGAISYWPLAIGAKGSNALLLGPLAVHPERQNRGIGLALMRETLDLAKSFGHGLVLLVGDATYYQRVGFAQVPEGKILMPGPVDSARLLYRELVSGSLAEAQGLIMAAHRHVG